MSGDYSIREKVNAIIDAGGKPAALLQDLGYRASVIPARQGQVQRAPAPPLQKYVKGYRKCFRTGLFFRVSVLEHSDGLCPFCRDEMCARLRVRTEDYLTRAPRVVHGYLSQTGASSNQKRIWTQLPNEFRTPETWKTFYTVYDAMRRGEGDPTDASRTNIPQAIAF